MNNPQQSRVLLVFGPLKSISKLCVTCYSMEVLAGASSILSLLDVVARSSITIHGLILKWKDIPAEILALGNEVDDSKAVLNQACHFFYQFENIPHARSIHPNIPSLSGTIIKEQIEQTIPIWNELHTILRLFDAAGDHEIKACPKGVRIRWLKHQKKIGRIRQIIRGKRQSILELMGLSSA